MSFKSLKIQDDLSTSNTGAIEVVLECDDQEQRWCFFMTPHALASAGDWLEGTQVRVHFGNPNMIVVSEVSAQIIEQTLRQIQSKGLLESCTKPCISPPA